MNTARQAMENMEYVRRLLEEKQAGFAASVELAVSFVHHEIIEKQDPVHEWRVAQLVSRDIPGRP